MVGARCQIGGLELTFRAAYYFWNSRTNETTWINPLAPPPPSAAQAPAPSSSLPPLDPELTHLLPRESRPDAGASAGPGFVSAEFNARTGRFTPANFAYRVDHLAEANRARRQEAAFFDVDEWDKEREKEWAEKRAAGDDGDRPKKITKADMVRERAMSITSLANDGHPPRNASERKRWRRRCAIMHGCASNIKLHENPACSRSSRRELALGRRLRRRRESIGLHWSTWR